MQSACCCEGPSKEEHWSLILYIIDEANVDFRIAGGSSGCAVKAACGTSSFGIVRQVLGKGVSIDVIDDMGRMTIHFPGAQSK